MMTERLVSLDARSSVTRRSSSDKSTTAGLGTGRRQSSSSGSCAGKPSRSATSESQTRVGGRFPTACASWFPVLSGCLGQLVPSSSRRLVARGALYRATHSPKPLSRTPDLLNASHEARVRAFSSRTRHSMFLRVFTNFKFPVGESLSGTLPLHPFPYFSEIPN